MSGALRLDSRVCGAAKAQANKPARIGWLSNGSSAAEFPEQQVLDALRGSGWAAKRNLIIEFRHAAGNPERLGQMAAELAALNVDAILSFSAGVMPAKRATTSIPIVMQTSQDPVRAGLVNSLRAREGILPA